MLSTFPSSGNLLPRPTREHLFTTISRGEQRFRILSRECSETMTAISNLEIFWFIVALVQMGSMLDHFLQARQGLIIFGFGFVAVLIATSVAILYRNSLIKIVLFSLINLSTYLLVCTIMLAVEQKKLIIPTSIYIATQTIGSMVLLRDRSKLMAKFLVMVQLLVLILKLDNKIQCEWVEVYFGFLLVCFIGMVILISMTLFWAVNVLYFSQQLCSVKHIGLTFIFVQAFCCVMASMLPITEIFFGFSFLFTCVTALITNFCTILYARKFQTEIILFMCRVEKVKSYNQIITLVKIAASSISQYVFKKKSQNWYQRTTIKQVQKQQIKKDKTKPDPCKQNPQSTCKQHSIQTNAPQDSNMTIQVGSENSKCLICLQLQPCMIWMPCGHMTLCELCCDKMFESKNCNCLLCKDIPQAVYHVSEQGENMNKSILTHILSGQIDIDMKDEAKQKAIKDLDSIQSSLSGNINVQETHTQAIESSAQHNNAIQKQKGQIMYIRCAYSIKIS